MCHRRFLSNDERAGMEAAMKVALYLRVSTEEQRDRQSIETQRDFGERVCQLHQLQTVRFYVDDGVSGTVPMELRSAGKQVLEDARRGQFDQLLVFRLDRLGRETRLILNVVAELEKFGVRVKSMTEEFDTATSTGRLMLTMLSGFAAHERDAIRERSIAGTNRVAEAGAWLGGIVPYGYRKVGEKGDGEVVDGHLRLKAARKLGITEVPVILCDEWTPAQVKAFRLMVNRSVTWADWDEDLLAQELLELQKADFDLSLTGFDVKQIDDLLASCSLEAGHEDQVPDVPEVPVSRLGDL